MIIKCSDQGSLFGNSYSYTTINKKARVTMESNIEFISWHRDKYRPKSIKIGIYFCFNAISILDMICYEFENCAKALTSARDLELEVFAGPQSTLHEDADSSQEVNRIIDIASRFASLVPRIDTVNFCRITGGTVYMDLVDELIKHYAHQLINVTSRPEAFHSTLEFSTQLKSLHVDCYLKPRVKLPSIHASYLTRLELDAVSTGFDWSSFISDPEAKNIAFESLEYFYFGTSFLPRVNVDGIELWRTSGGKLQNKLSMPSLKYLRTFASPIACSLLSCTTFPERLETLKLAIMDKAEMELTNTRLNSQLVQQVFARYASSSTHEHDDDYDAERNILLFDFTTFTNEIFSIPELADSSFLSIGYAVDDYFDVNKIQWDYLTKLAIAKTIEFKDLLDLVKRLPRLVDMIAINVCNVSAVIQLDGMANDGPETQITASSDKKPVEQYASILQRLSLDNERLKWSEEVSVEIRSYLMARISTLVFVSC
ncbi:hypothetical protein LPJ59_000160 [Coemansia sp. RSA 2399]|nr:hypothetical protein LPJ59_000160 [Coemansia sp. RSA 2399]